MIEFVSVFAPIVVMMIAITILLKHYQRKLWNNGYCSCGGIWRSFDVDSGGATGYKCGCCQNVIWLDWYTPDREIDAMGILKR